MRRPVGRAGFLAEMAAFATLFGLMSLAIGIANRAAGLAVFAVLVLPFAVAFALRLALGLDRVGAAKAAPPVALPQRPFGSVFVERAP